MSPAPVRFHDPGVLAGDFAGYALVRCPRCARIAHSTRGAPTVAGARSGSCPQWRLVCRSCGLCRTRPTASRGAGHPPGRPDRPVLWLRAGTRHGEIWAYNLEHLDLLRRFVAASLRERAPWYEHGRKMTYVGRLPAWVKSAKNRAEVLRVVDRMRVSVIRTD
ncbi:hypothetical protein OG985_10055 [Streptomyces sp. NBC_00289]|uniref:hypothetical protein n=1 Tax=Streptomyces sp. NBC_00289 TaxID=2975703 RepID=UPI003249854B